jgi:hypothetical protein
MAQGSGYFLKTRYLTYPCHCYQLGYDALRMILNTNGQLANSKSAVS